MKNIHHLLDDLEGALRSRKPQAPVHSKLSDIERFSVSDLITLYSEVRVHRIQPKFRKIYIM